MCVCICDDLYHINHSHGLKMQASKTFTFKGIDWCDEIAATLTILITSKGVDGAMLGEDTGMSTTQCHLASRNTKKAS